MKAKEIRQKYLDFFKERGHAIVPSARLVPENDPTTLFTGSGMQPMVPYLLGERHPLGTRIADSQKSFRTGDIEDVGDNRHTTFFEMLGNWSFGDYFKEEQLSWIFKFLTEEIGLSADKLYVTVFSGDSENGLSPDSEAILLWKKLFAEKNIEAKNIFIGTEEEGARIGMQGARIFEYKEKNWWSRAGVPEKMPAGEPGGPDSEIFYEFSEVEHDSRFGQHCHPNCDCGRYIEIGNSVFMQFKKVADKKFENLPKKNIDFGGGLERISMAAQSTNDIFQIDVFKSLIEGLEKNSGTTYTDKKYTASYRVVADHVRAAMFLIGDGVLPSNTDQGYFVRRLIRRAVRHADRLHVDSLGLSSLILPLVDYYKDAYPEIEEKKQEIQEELSREEERFRKTLRDGLKQLELLINKSSGMISGEDAFNIYQTYGFPLELSLEICKERSVEIDTDDFKKRFVEHQNLSRSGSEQKFKGGLGGTGIMETRYHTATHLLNEALREVLGDHVGQKGSNITSERLRFDFSHNAKMTPEEKKKVEDIVNEKIFAALPVQKIMMSKEKALETGARHVFGEKYGDEVSIYFVGNSLEKAFSKEFCGGPHVGNTSELGHFKIIKEEAVSLGVRRIKAILE